MVFDKPAVPNPIETAEAHARFKRGTRIALGGAVWLVIIGGAVYAGWSVMHADEGGVSVDLPKEEMERKVQEAQKGHGKGSYAALAVKR